MKFITNAALVTVSFLAALVALEVLSWIVKPVMPTTTNVSTEGREIEINDRENRHRLRPHLSFFQVSSEFRVRVTTTALGYRGPAADVSPETIFVGDSFTFGHGLADDETFPFLYCRDRNMACANLGRSGTGTIVQLDTLDHYLQTEMWRPRFVFLFVFAMVDSLSSGNDLFDNVLEARAVRSTTPAVSQGETSPTNADAWALDLARKLLDYSNFARIVYFYFAAHLRRPLAFAPDLRQEALEITAAQFERLEILSQRYGFDYLIAVIHPIQDILRGSNQATFTALKRAARGAKVISTAPIFSGDPKRYYYSYDGHLNKVGARAVADFLLEQTEGRGSNTATRATSR